MLEILVVLTRKQVERRTATAATALQAIFVSINVDQEWISRGICAFLAQSHKNCRMVTSPENWRQTTKLEGMLPLPLRPNTRDFTQMSTTPLGHTWRLLLWRNQSHSQACCHPREKILNMTSRQVSSLPARDVVIWFFTREESDHYITCKKAKVLLSNWKIVTEQLTGVPSIPMSVRQLDRIPLTSMMQQHQKILQIMSNGKFKCTSEMFSQIMECFCVTPYSIFCKCSLTA